MYIKLKTRIWLAIFSIVMMFAIFTLFYFPARQASMLLKDYNQEVQNLANTVALGVQIALTEENYTGVQTAVEYVKDNPALQFISLVQDDTLWDAAHRQATPRETVIKTYPADAKPLLSTGSFDSIIVKRSPFVSAGLTGSVVLGFSTKAIEESKKSIRLTSLWVSLAILAAGSLIGLWLSRHISLPVIALRNAVREVGQGNLHISIRRRSNDEIGDLARAFNKMVVELRQAQEKLRSSNESLTQTNQVLHNTVHELKATQAQLIQSEKMASLGELTAGIAHEIQNPLNFVNNFSEVSIELAAELQEELQALPLPEAQQESILSIASDLVQNQQKINYHGRRADAIVKGMLQHSRKSTGQKELTDINALADEYLRLSYHGLRAKDKSFNASIETHFEPGLEKLHVVPQDIGRVLLNLYTNAFYAVSQKKKALQGSGYVPTVTVTTSRAGGGVQITVKDNGNGIPDKIKSKLFQPFFTTKPAGEGTGLGLSISYDIVVKEHGGILTVASEEGVYSAFTLTLPAP